MSEYTSTNCGACGDRYPFDAKHECWVIEKVQTQETILEICPICFTEIRAPHWRCENLTHPMEVGSPLDVQP